MLLRKVPSLVPYQPRLYYIDRHSPDPATRPQQPVREGPRSLTLQREWKAIVTGLVASGYLDRFAGDCCEDGKENEQPQRISELIAQNCGMSDQWPLDFQAGPLAPEHFFTLVEVFHDLVARPRTRFWHDYDGHFLFYDYHERAGQAVYRWKVNELFERHQLAAEITETGAERGLVVTRWRDPRQDLLRIASTAASVDANQDRVQHAIGLYRKRNSSPDDKIRACRELADALESRRQAVLKPGLLKGDEPDLFQLMNKFGIRHHREDQLRAYDPVFLDWIFWWFLAAVETSSRIMMRDPTADRGTSA